MRSTGISGTSHAPNEGSAETMHVTPADPREAPGDVAHGTSATDGIPEKPVPSWSTSTVELDDSENRPGHEEGRGDDSRQEVAQTQTIPESFRDFAQSLAGPSGISWSPALPILPETMPLKPEPTTDADVRTWIRAVSPHVVSRGPGASSVPAQIQRQAHVPGFLRKSNCRREKPQSRRAGARDIQEQPVRRTRRAC